MERLCPLVIGVAFLCTCPSHTLGEDVCSLRVRVLSPQGARLEAPIEVTDASGRTESREQQPGGRDVEFCDLGILPVSVRIGSLGLCNGVTVRDVPVSWNATYLLSVTYDPVACMIRHQPPPPVPACEFLLRIRDSHGSWVPKASVTFRDPKLSPVMSDRYGRAWFIMPAGKEVHGSITASGFRTADFVPECAKSERQRELYITLEKQ